MTGLSYVINMEAVDWDRKSQGITGEDIDQLFEIKLGSTADGLWCYARGKEKSSLRPVRHLPPQTDRWMPTDHTNIALSLSV